MPFDPTTGDTGVADHVRWGSAVVGGVGSNAIDAMVDAPSAQWGFTVSDIGTDIPFGYQLELGVMAYGPPVVVGTYTWDGTNPPVFTV